MPGFTKLDSGIIDSSIWDEPSDVLKLFQTFWAKSDSKGVVLATEESLYRTANLRDMSGQVLPVSWFNECLRRLLATDPRSRSQENEGRRIVRLGPSKWQIVTYQSNREKFHYSDSPEAIRQRKHRLRNVTCHNESQGGRDVYASASASGTESGKGVQRETHFPEIPDFESVKLEAVNIGLPEWRAFDWFNDMESSGWRYKGEQVRNWRAFMIRLKTWWESDGRPVERPVRGSGNKKAKSVFELKTILEAKERQIQELRRVHCSEAAMGENWDSTESKTQFRQLRSEIKQLTAQIASS